MLLCYNNIDNCKEKIVFCKEIFCYFLSTAESGGSDGRCRGDGGVGLRLLFSIGDVVNGSITVILSARGIGESGIFFASTCRIFPINKSFGNLSMFWKFLRAGGIINLLSTLT